MLAPATGFRVLRSVTIPVNEPTCCACKLVEKRMKKQKTRNGCLRIGSYSGRTTTQDGKGSMRKRRLAQLYMAIALLTEVEKAIVMLYLEEHTYTEMEEILGLSQGNLRVKMNRIKEKLRQLTKTTDYGT